ncbi:PTS lactose/cellobiose transporter subunit IIA [Oceanobacillus kapialis]|uniref:PTS lactose/cellobiose transporter subunit IIA n=1 Tax=Oceanobacillus kapialis TaxID=481353 RepID=A0ABW5PWT7_9BACI
MNTEEISFHIILHGGNARSCAMEAMRFAKDADFTSASEKIKEAKKELGKAHRFQTDLIQGEAKGERKEVNVLLVHAQDHFMNAMTITDLANEMIEVHRRLVEK